MVEATLEVKHACHAVPSPAWTPGWSEYKVRLDLQALIDQAYARGRYDFLDYTQPPDPPLGERDGPMADEILKAAGKR